MRVQVGIEQIAILLRGVVGRPIILPLSPAIKNMDMSKAVPSHDSQLLVPMKAK